MKLTEWQAKMIFGLLILLVLFVLAVIVARESAALQAVSNTDLAAVIAGLLTLAGGFANWAFGKQDGGPPKQ